MIKYKMFLFVDEAYGLEDYIPIMYAELVAQFNLHAGIENYFEDQSFGLIMDSDKGVYTNLDYEKYYFLDTYLVFPPNALSFTTTICWKKNENDIPNFLWTSNFPKKALIAYIKENGGKRL